MTSLTTCCYRQHSASQWWSCTWTPTLLMPASGIWTDVRRRVEGTGERGGHRCRACRSHYRRRRTDWWDRFRLDRLRSRRHVWWAVGHHRRLVGLSDQSGTTCTPITWHEALCHSIRSVLTTPSKDLLKAYLSGCSSLLVSNGIDQDWLHEFD